MDGMRVEQSVDLQLLFVDHVAAHAYVEEGGGASSPVALLGNATDRPAQWQKCVTN
jgi:hypothetical protein